MANNNVEQLVNDDGKWASSAIAITANVGSSSSVEIDRPTDDRTTFDRAGFDCKTAIALQLISFGETAHFGSARLCGEIALLFVAALLLVELCSMNLRRAHDDELASYSQRPINDGNITRRRRRRWSIQYVESFVDAFGDDFTAPCTLSVPRWIGCRVVPVLWGTRITQSH